jgi:calcium-independent phospholipase A2-gamma
MPSADCKRIRKELLRLRDTPEWHIETAQQYLAVLAETAELLSNGGRYVLFSFVDNSGFSLLDRCLSVISGQARSRNSRDQLRDPKEGSSLRIRTHDELLRSTLRHTHIILHWAQSDVLHRVGRSPLVARLCRTFANSTDAICVERSALCLGTIAACDREFALLIIAANGMIQRLDHIFSETTTREVSFHVTAEHLPPPSPHGDTAPKQLTMTVPHRLLAACRRLVAAMGIERRYGGHWRLPRERILGMFPNLLRRPKTHGVRILTLDGGGARALVSIEILRDLERRTGQPIHQLFDLVAGTSAGGILAIALCIARKSLDDCEQLYREFCSKVFSAPSNRAVRWLGMGRLLFSRGYYDSATLEKFFRAFAGEMNLIDSRAVSQVNDEPPYVFCVSTMVSESPATPFLHTNYAPPPESKPRYRYAAHHRLYEALRATSAAPTYFDAFRCGGETFCDGAILVNNPTAIACHEAKLLWPDLPIDALVSVGTGRCDPRLVSEQNQRVGPTGPSGDSIFELARTLLSSATDTEAVHHAVLDLTHGRDMYFRLNPDVAPLSMDETRIEKLEELQRVTQKYIEQNAKLFAHVATKINAGAGRKEPIRAAL